MTLPKRPLSGECGALLDAEVRVAAKGVGISAGLSSIPSGALI